MSFMEHITQWGVAATIALLVVAAWCWRSHLHKRREQFARGEIRKLKSIWTDVSGLRIHTYISTLAAGRPTTPIVLVHGFGVSGTYFLPTAERLATTFDVFAPDLPGHGRSDTPSRALDISQLADALLDWMDAMHLTQPAFVANSMGCQVVVQLAVRHPDRVARLVLIGPAVDPCACTVLQHIPRFLLDVPYERPSLIWVVVKDYLRMNWRAVKELRYMMDDRIEEKLPRVTAPTMLVRGQNDTIAPQRWIDEAARLVCAELVAVIRDQGHGVNYSAPDKLVAAINDFLRPQETEPNVTPASRL